MNRFHPLHAACGQRGLVMLAFLALLGILLPVALVLSAPHRTDATLHSRQQSLQALLSARQALLARAIKGRRDVAEDTSPFRPGSLPCPDVNDDGGADGAYCFNYIGRFPYKTLETDDLRDGAGERLWYALSPHFRPNDPYVTSNTTAQIQLTGPGAPTTKVVALLFAPGAVIGTQSRGCNVAGDLKTCAALNVANYLEGANAHFIDSANLSAMEAKFETRTNDPAFNDMVLPITTDMFMPQVEQRIAREALGCLRSYASLHAGRFPWAAAAGAGGMLVEQGGSRFGHLPAGDTWPLAAQVCRAVPPYAYFDAWRPLIFYAVSEAFQPEATSANGCGTTCLQVNGIGGVKAAVLLAGPPIGAIGQSPAGRVADAAPWPQFLEQNLSSGLSRRRAITAGSASFNDTLVCLSEDAKGGPCAP